MSKSIAPKIPDLGCNTVADLKRIDIVFTIVLVLSEDQFPL
jgi:hypothetical protein